MAVRPPSQFFSTSDKDPLAQALEQEILSEKADTLARLMKKLEATLARLAGHEERIANSAADPAASQVDPTRQDHLEHIPPNLNRIWRKGYAPSIDPGANSDHESDPAFVESALIAEAGEALWHVVIQRELCGIRRHDGLMRELAVPPAVRLRMGPASLGTKPR